jgi:hypothetical protein
MPSDLHPSLPAIMRAKNDRVRDNIGELSPCRKTTNHIVPQDRLWLHRCYRFAADFCPLAAHFDALEGKMAQKTSIFPQFSCSYVAPQR